MQKRGILVLFIIFSAFFVVAEYGDYDPASVLTGGKVDTAKTGFHDLRLITNGSAGFSVDANEDGIIDLAESLVGGVGAGGLWSTCVGGICYTGGNVGIGTIDPQSRLAIQNNGGTKLYSGVVDAGHTWIGFYRGAPANDHQSGYVGYDTAGTDTLTLKNNNGSILLDTGLMGGNISMMTGAGNVGIGTTSPERRLHIVGESPGTKAAIIVEEYSEVSGAQPDVFFRRAQGTPASPQDVAEFDKLGSIRFYGYIDGDFEPISANIDAIVESTVGTVVRSGIRFETTDDSNVLGERVRIDRNGNVGIGTTTPSEKLDVDGKIHATGDICTDLGGGGLGVCLSTGGGGSGLWTSNPNNDIYYNLGNVGINTTDPVAALTVQKDGGTRLYSTVPGGGHTWLGFYRGISPTGTQAGYIGYDTSGTNNITLKNTLGDFIIDTGVSSGDIIMQTGAGNVGIGNTNPGAKLTFPDLTVSTTADGMAWYSPAPTAYGIYKTAGAWSAPNYQQLQLSFATGIVIDGGSAYGKSGTVLQPNGGNVGIGTANPGSNKLEVVGGPTKTTGGLIIHTCTAGGSDCPDDPGNTPAAGQMWLEI